MDNAVIEMKEALKRGFLSISNELSLTRRLRIDRGLTRSKEDHTIKVWTFDWERLGSPVKPPQGASLSRCRY